MIHLLVLGSCSAVASLAARALQKRIRVRSIVFSPQPYLNKFFQTYIRHSLLRQTAQLFLKNNNTKQVPCFFGTRIFFILFYLRDFFSGSLLKCSWTFAPMRQANNCARHLPTDNTIFFATTTAILIVTYINRGSSNIYARDLQKIRVDGILSFVNTHRLTVSKQPQAAGCATDTIFAYGATSHIRSGCKIDPR